MDLNFNEFIKSFDKAIDEGKEPKSIVIGYKTYSNLMKEDKFVKHISTDVKDPLVRYFKRVEIQIVPEKRYLEIN